MQHLFLAILIVLPSGGSQYSIEPDSLYRSVWVRSSNHHYKPLRNAVDAVNARICTLCYTITTSTSYLLGR